MAGILKDRRQAGRILAQQLRQYAHRRDCIVLALPRGGVVVADEIAQELGLPLDVLLVRKLGVPFQPELAMGAIASGGVVVWNREVLQELAVPEAEIQAVVSRENQELARREKIYRAGRPLPEIRDKVVLLVDDGIATGSTMEAAISALTELQAKRIVVAAPVAPRSTILRLQQKADDVIYIMAPEPFLAISRWYDEFPQVSDQEVQKILAGTREHTNSPLT